MAAWRSFKKNWLSDPSTYPCIAIAIGGGTLVCGAQCARRAFTSPDMRFARDNRSAALYTDSQTNQSVNFYKFSQSFRGTMNALNSVNPFSTKNDLK